MSCQLGRVLGLMQLPVPNFGLGWVSFLGSPIPNSHGTDPFPDRSLLQKGALQAGTHHIHRLALASPRGNALLRASERSALDLPTGGGTCVTGRGAEQRER